MVQLEEGRILAKTVVPEVDLQEFNMVSTTLESNSNQEPQMLFSRNVGSQLTAGSFEGSSSRGIRFLGLVLMLLFLLDSTEDMRFY